MEEKHYSWMRNERIGGGKLSRLSSCTKVYEYHVEQDDIVHMIWVHFVCTSTCNDILLDVICGHSIAFLDCMPSRCLPGIFAAPWHCIVIVPNVIC